MKISKILFVCAMVSLSAGIVAGARPSIQLTEWDGTGWGYATLSFTDSKLSIKGGNLVPDRSYTLVCYHDHYPYAVYLCNGTTNHNGRLNIQSQYNVVIYWKVLLVPSNDFERQTGTFNTLVHTEDWLIAQLD